MVTTKGITAMGVGLVACLVGVSSVAGPTVPAPTPERLESMTSTPSTSEVASRIWEVAAGPHTATLVQPDGTEIPLPAMTERQLEPLLEDITGSIQAGLIPVMQPGAILQIEGEGLTPAHFVRGPGSPHDVILVVAVSMTERREWGVHSQVSRHPGSQTQWDLPLSGPLGDIVVIARDGATIDKDVGHIIAIAGSPLVP